MTPDEREPADAILLIGCGNMGGAMLRGWLAEGRKVASGRMRREPYGPTAGR